MFRQQLQLMRAIGVMRTIGIRDADVEGKADQCGELIIGRLHAQGGADIPARIEEVAAKEGFGL
jgi:hypothetical protein